MGAAKTDIYSYSEDGKNEKVTFRDILTTEIMSWLLALFLVALCLVWMFLSRPFTGSKTMSRIDAAKLRIVCYAYRFMRLMVCCIICTFLDNFSCKIEIR